MILPSLLVTDTISLLQAIISIIILIVFDVIIYIFGIRIYKVGILNYSSNKLFRRMLKAIKDR
jgi:ABC-2 type transport system permease protein